MSDEDALLVAIAAHPAEDTPRLMYADWLDEHGTDPGSAGRADSSPGAGPGSRTDPGSAGRAGPGSRAVRAEFIRVQCAVKQLEQRPAEEQRKHVRLWLRNDELLTQHRADLLGPLGAELTYFDVIFDRGFVSELTLTAPVFLRHAADIRALRPVPRIRVTQAGGTNLGFLLDCPELALVESVSAGNGIGGRVLEVPDAAELARCPYLGRLEVLELPSNDIGDLGLQHLAFSTNLPALTELNLSGNEITDSGLETLLGSPLWPRLRRLDLSLNPLTDLAAELLTAAARTDLEHLNLRFTNIGSEGHMLLLRQFGGRVDLF